MKLVYPDSCPDCGYSLSRSRRRGWLERLCARWFKIAVFRCHRCGARFYSPPAVVVRAPGVKADRARGKSDPDALERVASPAVETPVAKLVVKLSSQPTHSWPVARHDWSQPVRNTASGTPFLWVRSSTSDARKDDDLL